MHMKKIYTLLLAASCVFGMKTATAQCSLSTTATRNIVCSGDTVTLSAIATPPVNNMALNTTMAAGNNHRGNMFDITAVNTVTITAFDASPMGNTTIAIYYKTGTWNGFANTPGAWTLIGSAAVIANTSPTPTPVPVPVNITIPAGQTYGFYVTSTNTAVSLNYTDGSSVGNVYSSDANIQFREGGGMEYPFTGGTGSVFQPRIWNGVIHYSVPVAATYSYLWSTTATTQSIQPMVFSTTQYTVEANVTGCPTMYDTLNITVSTPPVDAGNDIVSCMGTPVTLSASGAVSYVWDHGVTDGVPFTPPGTQDYIVDGTDTLGCHAWDTVTVTVNTLPNVSAGNDTSVCSGSMITLSGSGASSYSWDNGVTDGVAFTPASTMSYIVTGTDSNSCVNSDTVMVTVNMLPNVSAGNDTAICIGSSVTLSGSGATSYVWDNSVTDGVSFMPQATMVYTVTGTDGNGCSNIDSVEVAVLHVPIIFAGADLVLCAGNLATVTATGGMTYLWDHGIQDGVPFAPITDDYTVIGFDSLGCSDTDVVHITVDTIVNVPTVSNQTLTSQPFITYQWIDCSTSNPISGATSQSYTATANGNYAVIVLDTNGCIDTSDCQQITGIGIASYSVSSLLQVYPNPASDNVTVNTGTTIVDALEVLDVTGKLLESRQPNSTSVQIDLASYADGVYFIRVKSAGASAMVKLIKN